MQCSAYLYSFSRAVVSAPTALGDLLRLEMGSSFLSQSVSDHHWVICNNLWKISERLQLDITKIWKYKESIWDYLQQLVKVTCFTRKFLSLEFCSLGPTLHSLFRILSDFHLFGAWLLTCIPIRSDVIFLINSLTSQKDISSNQIPAWCTVGFLSPKLCKCMMVLSSLLPVQSKSTLQCYFWCLVCFEMVTPQF